MNGFRVDTTELSETSIHYHAVGRQLDSDGQRLLQALTALAGQTINEEIRLLLRMAQSSLEESIQETHTLGSQCTQIAAVYDRTERRVAALVAGLPTTVAVLVPSAGLMLRFPSNPQNAVSDMVKVKSLYRSAEPVIVFSGNKLPVESWLLMRCAKNHIEKNG